MAAAAAATSAGASRIWTTAEWAALKTHAEAIGSTHLRDLLDVSLRQKQQQACSCCLLSCLARFACPALLPRAPPRIAELDAACGC